jgi:hypothetical protein
MRHVTLLVPPIRSSRTGFGDRRVGNFSERRISETGYWPMSDDIPLIFAEDLARPDTRRRAVFLSAMSAAQMQQYAAAQWDVVAGPGFQARGDIDLAAVPARSGGEEQLAGADLVSLEAPTWPADAEPQFRRWAPRAIKVNAAFHNLDEAKVAGVAAVLGKLGYQIVACHWRDDNIYAIRSLSRIDRLEALGAPDWKHVNLIALRDADLARLLLTIGRLYVGEERRIAELRLSHAVRGDHIARLEDAMMALQKRAAS